MNHPPPTPQTPSEPDLAQANGPGPTRVGRRVLVNTGSLAGSSLWRIAISFVLQVFIARQLDIPGVGIYNAALAYLNVGQVVGEIGLPNLLVRNLAQNPHHRRALFFMSLRLQLGMAFLVWAGLSLFALLLEPSSRMALWIVGASLPFYAVTSTSQTIFQASERMELLMGVEWVINGIILGLSLAVLLGGGGILALVSVLVLAQALSALICLFLLYRSALLAGPQLPVPPFGYRELWAQAVPFFRLSIADVLLQRLDILLISLLGGEVVTGIYSLAYNLVRVLSKLVQSFWQALYPTFSRLFHHADGKYPVLADLSLRYGLIALLPAAALSAVVAPQLIPFIFSSDYQESAAVYRILIWLTPFFFLANYASTQLLVQRRPKASLLIAGAHLLALIVLLSLLTPLAQAQGAAWASLVAAIVGALTGSILLRRHHIQLTFQRFPSLMIAVLSSVAGALLLPYIVPIAVLGVYWPLQVWPLQVLAGGAIYLLLVWLLGIVIPSDIQVFRRALSTTRSEAQPLP